MSIRTSTSLSSIGVAVLVVALTASPVLADETERDGLRSAEVKASQRASRAFFAAQRAERRDAEAAGLPELVEQVKALRKSVRILRRMEEVPELGLSASALSTVDGAAVPGAAPASATPSPRRERVRSEFREQRRLVRAQRQALLANLSKIQTHRQREIAGSVLRSLDSMDQQFTDVLEGGPQQRRQRLRRLEERLGDVGLEEPTPPQLDGGVPNMTTIIKHRNPVRRSD